MNKNFFVGLSAVVFGFGLAWSNMVRPEVVLDFLQLNDLGLLFVLFPAAIISGLAFHFLAGRKTLSGTMTYGFRRYPYGRHVIPGAIIFGIGWGISGVCPGAGIASLGVGNYPILIALVGMALGTVTWGYVKKQFPKSKIVIDNCE